MMQTIFDTHVHYNLEPLAENWEQFFTESVEQGVVGGVIVGTSLESSQKALDIARKKATLFSSIGIHPTDEVVKDLDLALSNLQKLIDDSAIEKQKKLVAIGEIGLDYARLQSDSEASEQEKTRQKQVFSNQLELAEKNNLPVILHCRDAHKDMFEILSTYTLKKPVVFHCMSGGVEELSTALEFDSYISFAANITYPKSEVLRELVRKTPINRLLLETDAPYLPPQSSRGKLNHPKFIRETFEAVAELKGVTLDELSKTMIENSMNCFEIEVKL